MIIYWQENLPEKELPPRWMWALDEDLSEHFDRIKAQRDNPNANDDSDDQPGAPMLINEYAKGRGRHAR